MVVATQTIVVAVVIGIYVVPMVSVFVYQAGQWVLRQCRVQWDQRQRRDQHRRFQEAHAAHSRRTNDNDTASSTSSGGGRSTRNGRRSSSSSNSSSHNHLQSTSDCSGSLSHARPPPPPERAHASGNGAPDRRDSLTSSRSSSRGSRSGHKRAPAPPPAMASPVLEPLAPRADLDALSSSSWSSSSFSSQQACRNDDCPTGASLPTPSCALPHHDDAIGSRACNRSPVGAHRTPPPPPPPRRLLDRRHNVDGGEANDDKYHSTTRAEVRAAAYARQYESDVERHRHQSATAMVDAVATTTSPEVRRTYVEWTLPRSSLSSSSMRSDAFHSAADTMSESIGDAFLERQRLLYGFGEPAGSSRRSRRSRRD